MDLERIPFRVALGAEICRLRKEKNMTQKELALAVGVTKQAVCMIESGRRAPAQSKYGNFALVLGVEPSHFLEIACAT